MNLVIPMLIVCIPIALILLAIELIDRQKKREYDRKSRRKE